MEHHQAREKMRRRVQYRGCFAILTRLIASDMPGQRVICYHATIAQVLEYQDLQVIVTSTRVIGDIRFSEASVRE